MKCRNDLWRMPKKRKKYHGCSDIKVYNPDGTTETIIAKYAPPPQPAKYTEIEEEEYQRRHQRDNERYAEWRNAILTRDRKQCVLCQSKEWPQVHHIVRWADDKSKRYDLQNGVVLCMVCHDKHHGYHKKPFPAKITAMLFGYIRYMYGGPDGRIDQTIPLEWRNNKTIARHQQADR